MYGIYPIADSTHFFTSGTIILISGVYFVFEIYNKIFANEPLNEKSKKVLKILTVSLLIICEVLAIAGIIYFLANCERYTLLENFKYIPNYEDQVEEILEVDEYIEEQDSEVYILDARAALYMIPINRYNKDYDMMNCGNLGENGSERLIADLESKENVKLLILTDLNNLNWQTPLNMIQYVLDNYTKTGEIGIFSIYEKE